MKFRRGLTTIPIGLLLVGTTFASTAGASTSAVPTGNGFGRPQTLACGSVVTQNTRLASDVGPCTGDGLIVTGSNIRLDLAGHSVFGEDPATEAPDATEQVGIHLMNGASNDDISNGNVYWFDAGVALDANSNGNTIERINAHDNVNDLVTTAGSTDVCSYGDGITTDNASHNLIQNNVVVHNGPFSGIALVDASDNSTVRGNYVSDNDIPNRVGGTLTGPGARGCGAPFSRPEQDIGIRIEGPGAVNDVAENNFVTRSSLDAISIHGYAAALGAAANHDDSILHNIVSWSGLATNSDDPDNNGIGILRQGPLGVVCVAYHNTVSGNISYNNFQYGIFLGGPVGTNPGCTGSGQNTVTNNTVYGNHIDGIHVNAGSVNNTLTGNLGFNNTRFDGADFNPACDNNAWMHNTFRTVNQPCVATGGSGRVQQVVVTGVAGASGAKTLTTTWSAPVTVTNPAGFTVYSDATCTTLVGTGQSVTSASNGTVSPVITLNTAPPAGHAFYQVAANSVSTSPGGVGNAAIGCTPVTFGK